VVVEYDSEYENQIMMVS